MTNKEIARSFNRLAKIMELHKENPYKIRSYANAYIQLRKLQQPLSEMSPAEMEGLKGVGKTISNKITELLETGQLETYQKYVTQTPPGVVEMLDIKGFGPKKIRVVWKELGAETIGELLYACNENRLVELKGFGQKTQEDLKQKLSYFQQSQGKFHYAALEAEADRVSTLLSESMVGQQVALVGEMRRRNTIVSKIELLTDANLATLKSVLESSDLTLVKVDGNILLAKTEHDVPVIIYQCAAGEWGSKLFRYTATDAFMKAFLEVAAADDFRQMKTEADIFEKAKLPYIEPELRESEYAVDLAKAASLPTLLEETQIKGVIHNHTTYSDGIHSLREMASYTKDQGYEYLVITDHSKSAFYANGLKPDRLETQWAEIDALNKELAPFKIFKGIESDILSDGSLDYDEQVLQQFDVIIASVHSNLKMDEAKATQRLLTAIANPYTTMLGHPTGRLLLSREGYPIDHKAIIDACAEHGVAIELNANPYRLDLDWSWIPYAMEKGVPISINPDAHSKEGIHDIHFGTLAARKGGLTAEACLNARSLADFEQWLSGRMS
ncbi:MAG: PHP domain-containing protein [Bacteroidota bacterium]